MGSGPESRAFIRTTWGTITVRARGGSLIACELPVLKAPPSDSLRVTGRPRLLAQPSDRRALVQAIRFVRACLSGRSVACPPLSDMARGSFTRRAREALRKIPSGRTCSYSELAARAGSPAASRAAGSACATNPLPLFIPCHRVLAAGGKLGGFSGGLAWKQELLKREGVLP